MSRLISLLLVPILVAPVFAFAQSGPATLDGPAGQKATVTTYLDSDGRQRGKKLPVSEMSFPLRVFEETPNGMARVRHAGEDYWVASEDFHVKREVKADCNVVADRLAAGAGRGANEGCAGTKRK